MKQEITLTLSINGNEISRNFRLENVHSKDWNETIIDMNETLEQSIDEEQEILERDDRLGAI